MIIKNNRQFIQSTGFDHFNYRFKDYQRIFKATTSLWIQRIFKARIRQATASLTPHSYYNELINLPSNHIIKTSVG